MSVNCCKDCPDRWVNDTGRCHDTCKKYINAITKHRTTEELKRQDANYDHIDYVNNVILKRRKRYGN